MKTTVRPLVFTSRPLKCKVDKTLYIWQSRQDWLKKVRNKYGPSGDKMAKTCDELIPAEVQSMSQLNKVTGKNIPDILAEAEATVGINAF